MMMCQVSHLHELCLQEGKMCQVSHLHELCLQEGKMCQVSRLHELCFQEGRMCQVSHLHELCLQEGHWDCTLLFHLLTANYGDGVLLRSSGLRTSNKSEFIVLIILKSMHITMKALAWKVSTLYLTKTC